MDYRSLVKCLRGALPDVAQEELPEVIGELERLKALTWHRMMSETQLAPVPSHQEKLLTMKEVASLLNIPISCAYDLTRQGKLRSIRTGVNEKYVRVRPHDLEAYKNRMDGVRVEE